MSMSMWVKFFRAPEDEDLKRKLDAAYACEKAGVMLPAELEHYFQPVLRKYGELPGNRSDAIDQMLSMGPEFKEQEKYKWSDKGAHREGFEVDLRELPPGVAKIRFYCSW